MSEKNTKSKAPMSIRQQAEFIDYLVSRCAAHDGAICNSTLMVLTEDEAKDLQAIASRLHRMAPHEREIRRMVTGQ